MRMLRIELGPEDVLTGLYIVSGAVCWTGGAGAGGGPRLVSGYGSAFTCLAGADDGKELLWPLWPPWPPGNVSGVEYPSGTWASSAGLFRFR